MPLGVIEGFRTLCEIFEPDGPHIEIATGNPQCPVWLPLPLEWNQARFLANIVDRSIRLIGRDGAVVRVYNTLEAPGDGVA